MLQTLKMKLRLMRIFKAILLSVTILLSAGLSLSAQFYSNGSDPGSTKWRQVSTPNYQIIYPRGLDSLARSYGNELERFRLAESLSSGLVPGEGYSRKTPVVLHAFHGISNGSVTWAPKRLDLYTLPDAYNPEPLPWAKSLAVHESRHLAQMQFGYKGWLRPLTYVLGDMAVGAYSALWPNTWMLEGDAVVAETALTNMGRGRSADFLDYYYDAFRENDWRNWYRWRYGSYRHYTPNHYALGYMTIAGMRYSFGDTLFTERYFSRTASNPFRFFNLQKTVRQASGMKFKDTFSVIMQDFNEIRRKEWGGRGDHTAPNWVIDEDWQILTQIKWFTERSGLVCYDGKIYAISSSMAESTSLMEVGARHVIKRLHSFASTTSRLKAADGKLFWSESVADKRWDLKMTSRIKSYDLQTGKIEDITKSGRFFNPEPSKDGQLIYAVEYPVEGGSGIVIIDADSGHVLSETRLPDDLQAVEPCLFDNKLAFSAISERGSGIYCINEDLSGNIECLVEPQPVSIRNLRSRGNTLHFTSDRDGSQQLYGIDAGNTTVYQYSYLWNGCDNFCFDDSNNSVYYTMLDRNGRMLHETIYELLNKQAVDFSDVHRYPVAEVLSRQEKELAESHDCEWPDSVKNFQTTFSAEKKYHKSLNIPRFHSWAPIYFNYDNVMNLSGDLDYETASLGATALFQNSLGTAWGSVGYSFHKDPYSSLYRNGSHRFRHSGHALFTYTGLYPVFELSCDINDRAAMRYSRTNIYGSKRTVGHLSDKPFVTGTAKVYVPLNFSSNGISRGLIPQLEYSVSNDLYDKSLLKFNRFGLIPDGADPSAYGGFTKGDAVTMQSLKASLRGYVMRPVATSGTYPRLGIGYEAGYSTRLTLSDLYSASAYAYSYGYLPGITLTQGLKLTARFQHQFNTDWVHEDAITVAPRGYSNTDAEWFVRNFAKNHVKFTADYVIPIWFGDITWFCPVAYIKNFELTPHFDYTMFDMGTVFTRNGRTYYDSSRTGLANGQLYSVGATLVAKLANLLWIPYDCSIGVTFDYNGGKTYSFIQQYTTCRMSRTYVGFVFNISL